MKSFDDASPVCFYPLGVWEDALPEEQILQDPLYLRGVDFGEKRGIDIGEKRGIDIGEKRGIDIGEKRGEKRGVEKANRNMVLNLHKNGLDAATIARMSGLPLKFVRQVLEGKNNPPVNGQ